MSTTIRPELSERNPYWIEKHRYYELKHFCMQYPFWVNARAALDGLSRKRMELAVLLATGSHSDPTAKCALARAFYSERIEMLERVALNADRELASYILKGVTGGVSYDYLKARLDIPCCKDTYYDRYRRFFWLLHKERR